MNKDATSKFDAPPWRATHCAWLMACLIIAAVFAGRTLHFEFEEADYFAFPALIENQDAPWNIFINRPQLNDLRDGLFIPQTIEFVGSIHTKLFGLNPYAHQLALAAWWSVALVFLFVWNRRDTNTLAGLFAALLLIGMNAAWGALLSKQCLIFLFPLIVQLIALLALRKTIEASSALSGLLFLLFFSAAAYANGHVVFTLPIIAIVYLLSTQSGSHVAKTTVVVFMFIVLIALLATSTIQTHPFNWVPPLFHHLPTQGELLNDLAYPAEAMLSQRAMVGLALFAVTFALTKSGLTGWIAIALGAPAVASIYFACRYYNIPVWAAYALGMVFYVNLLWLAPWRRKIALPLAWFLLSFIRTYLFIGSEFDHSDAYSKAVSSVLYLETGVALAWILGVTLSTISAPGFSCFRNYRLRFRYGWRILAALLVLIALPLAIFEAYEDFDAIVKKKEAKYHTPYKLARAKLATDLLSITDKTLHSYGNGIRLFYDLPSQMALKSETRDRNNTITLEAYTGNTYFYQPEETYSGIYVEHATPAPNTLRDPLFSPHDWNSKAFGESENPIGLLTTQNDALEVEQTTSVDSSFAVGRDDFVITGWASCNQWQAMQRVSLTAYIDHREFVWHDVKFQSVGLGSRRFVIDAHDAAILRTPETSSVQIMLVWNLAPTDRLSRPVSLTIDRATLYIPKR